VVVAGTTQRGPTNDTDFGVARLLGDPPSAPTVSSPGSPVLVFDAASFTVQGNAAAGSLVKVYRDANNNGQLDAGDTLVGQQQLGRSTPAFAVNVPLTLNAANLSLAPATKFNSESAAAAVPVIVDLPSPPPPPPPPGVFAQVVKKKGKSYVRIFAADTGM